MKDRIILTKLKASNACLKSTSLAELEVPAVVLYSTDHIEPHHPTHSTNSDFSKN